MADPSPTTNYQQSEEETLNIFAYMFAGLAMMLNIRLSYSAAPYALLRFKLPENLFSVFVRTTSSALELWCLPSMLLGNIMEQAYNHTQDTALGIHATGITKSDLKNKANTLKTAAGTQSNNELTASRKTDLKQGNNQPQDKLAAKAGELQVSAGALNNKAQTLESAAQEGSPLKDLKDTAGNLKEAAKKASTGLYEKAGALATQAARSEAADTQANAVIQAFDKVEQDYETLMKKATDHKLTNDPRVIEVVNKYLEVENTYYQMLITFRIKQKATKFYEATKALQRAATQASDPETQLGKLQKKAKFHMIQLESTASTLKDIPLGESDTTIVTKYLEVEKDYKVLATKPEFKDALEAEPGVQEVKAVTTAFEALKKSIVNVLWLRIQELSQKAHTLSSKAQALSSVSGLREKAEALADAASHTGGPQGLQQKATALVGAINGTGEIGTQATDVIEAFDIVTARYDNLKAEAKKLGKQQNVKEVDTAYNELKNIYDKILNFAKISYFSNKLYTAANGNTSEVNNVIKNNIGVVTAYTKLDNNEQSIVKSKFTDLQTEYSNAIYFYKKCIITIPSIITNWLNFLTFVILFIVYISGGDQGSVTGYYWIMAISGFVFGINMVLVYAVDYRYLPYYIAGENSFPIVTSAILYFATSIFGNRRKYNSDYLVVLIDISISIVIALVASVLWTVAFENYRAPMAAPDKPNWPVISPVLLVIVGMGLVYSIYPGIAPGMIVPFYLIDKIEMVLLILTTFPPLIFAFTTKYAPSWSPKTNYVWHGPNATNNGFGGWKYYLEKKDPGHQFYTGSEQCDKSGEHVDVYGWIWHFFDILAPLQIILAIIFVYSIHYRDSSISRSIVNQPKMSTFLTIIFYMCHEIMLATGFPGLVCNGGVTYVLLPTQWVGALLMVLLAFYSIGYITEYKRHDPSQWPTDGMTKWNALCYWLKMASKITNKNFKQLFTTDLGRNLLIFIFYKVI